MRGLASVVVFVLAAMGAGECTVRAACSGLIFMNQVRVPAGALVLADLLSPDTCADLRRQAARVELGAAPQAGSLRVLDRDQLRRLVAKIPPDTGNQFASSKQIPERVEIRLTAATKSCGEIARAIAPAISPADINSRADLFWTADDAERWSRSVDCSGARGIPQEATLELRTTEFNSASQRWEFVLRCTQAKECGPFLVWSRSKPGGGPPPKAVAAGVSEKDLRAPPKAAAPTIRKGDSAMLVWDQAGIRVVVPVTCLDQGNLGQLVRARIKNADRTLWAEVAGAGSLRVGF